MIARPRRTNILDEKTHSGRGYCCFVAAVDKTLLEVYYSDIYYKIFYY